MFLPDALKGQRILVTGGGTGLGKEMASRFLALGADIIICGRRAAVLQSAASELMAAHQGSVETRSLDIRDAGAIDAMVAELWEGGHPLTGLVNNAAGNFISRTEDLSAGGFNAISDIVQRGTFYVTHAVGKRWIENGIAGTVLSIVAPFVRTGSPFVIPSAMSKAGIVAMTRSLAIEWGRYGIRLNAIAPGIFPTEGATARLRPGDDPHGYERSINPMGRLGKMPELTTLAAFLMAPGCEWLTGETIAIDGAQHLAHGAYYTQYMEWDTQQWRDARERIRAATAGDKEQRSAPPAAASSP